MQAKLKYFILYKNIIHINNIIKCHIEICLRIARKWLNYLKYKQKNIQKRVYFVGHKYKNMVTYGEIFLEQMKT